MAIRLLTLLGMLLLFAGITGFVVFAFGDLGKGWRPLAELLIPLSLFASAPVFRRLDAPFVARAVVAMGGVSLPIMASASLVDNAAPPSDPTGRAVGLMLFIIGCMITAGYALVAIRRKSSLLRFLVFPMLWLTVAAGALMMESSPPTGRRLFTPMPGQWAVVCCAIAITGILLRLRNDRMLIDAGRSAIMPGALGSFAIVWFATVGHQSATTPMIVAGVASIIAIETTSPRFHSSVISALQAGIVLFTSVLCFHERGIGPTAAVAVLALLAGIEWQAARRPSTSGATLFACAAAVIVPATLAESSTVLIVAGALFIWSWTRRFLPSPAIAKGLVDTTVWLSTAMATIGLMRLWSAPDALLFMAAASAVVAVGLRLPGLRPFGDDLLVGSWVLVVALMTLLALGQALLIPIAWHFSHRPAIGLITSVTASFALAAAPRWPNLRVWTATAGAFVALYWSGRWLDVDGVLTSAVIGTLADLLIVSAFLRRRSTSGHIGLAGLVAGSTAAFAAVAAPGVRGGVWPWATTGALLAAWIGWFIVESRGRAGESPVQELLQNRLEPTIAERTAANPDPPRSFVVTVLQFMVIAAAIVTVISAVASSKLATSPFLWGLALSSPVPLAAMTLGRHCNRRSERSGRGYVELGWGMGLAIALLTALVSSSATPTDGYRWPPPLATAFLLADTIALGPVRGWKRVAGWVIAIALWFQVAHASDITWQEPSMSAALLVISSAATLGATRSEGTERHLLQSLGAVAAAAAWTSFLGWADLDSTGNVVAHSAATIAVVMVLSIGMRIDLLRADWSITWSWVPAIATIAAVIGAFRPETSDRIGHLAAAAAVAIWAVALAMLARRFGQPMFRIVCAFIATGACWVGVLGFDPTPSVAIAGASAVAILLVGAGATLHILDRPTWVSSAFAGALLASASAVAVGTFPDCPHPATIAGLIVAAAVLTAVGSLRREIGWNITAVLAVLIAWLVFAHDALNGDPQWVTLPTGIALLASVELARFDRRRGGIEVEDHILTIVDIAAMTLIVGNSMIGLVDGSTPDGLLTVATGVMLGALGLLTRVRRRLIFGSVAVVLAVILLLLPPLVGLVPTDARWLPWALLIVAGVSSVLIAALVERGRRAMHGANQKFAELTKGWE